MRRLFTYLFLLILQCSEGTGKSTLFLSPNGKDTRSCGKRNEPCRTLVYVYDLHVASGFNSTLLSLAKGKYNLSRSLTFMNVNNFSITSENDDGPNEVEITCEPDAGIAFFFSQNITLQGLRLLNCGGWQENAALYANATIVKLKTAINFDYCRNIRMRSVDISESIGRALHLYEIGGLLEITNCRFENNSADTYKDRREEKEQEQQKVFYLVSGGGVLLTLNNYSRYRPEFMNVTPEEHEKYIHGNKYVFTNCSFLRNELSSGKELSRKYFQESFNQQFTSGGGLGIFFFGGASNSTVRISNCTFLDNKAPWGGGLQAEFADHSSRNFLLVENGLFEHNFGYSAGGGARLGVMLTRGVSVPMNEVRFVNSVFRRNWGKWGGGVSLYGTTIFCKCRRDFNSRNTFNFQSCHWLENSATIGSAIGAFLFNQNEDHIGPEVPIHAEFNRCQVKHNRVDVKKPNVRIGQGTIYSFGISFIFRGKMIIANNTFTALVLDGAGTLEIHDHVEFFDNKGFRGGAMAMYEHSKIILMKKSLILFKNNSCFDKGGAIFLQAYGSPQISYNVTGRDHESCFLAYEDWTSNFDDWDTQVIFQDNRAPDDSSGNSVFATTLKHCLAVGETRENNSALHWTFITYNVTSRPAKATDGLHLNQTRIEIATDPVKILYNPRDWTVSPSQVFNPSIKLVDEKGNSVSGVVNVLVWSNNGWKEDASSTSIHLQTPSSLFLVDGNVLRGLKLGGNVGLGFNVSLRHIGRQILQSVIPLESGLKMCNPGFYLSNGSCVCQTEKKPKGDSQGISRCDKNGKTVYLKRGFWGGITANGNFITYRCPKSFCNCPRGHESILAEDECVFVKEEMCAGHRDPESILCGKCKPGYSIVEGNTSACFKCHNYRFLGYIWLYLAIILGLVMLTMVLDIDAFTGSLNAILYSYQVIWQVVGDGFIFKDYFMLFILHLANFHLYVGTHLCYWSQMDYADNQFLALCSPVLTLLLVIILAKLVAKYPNCCFSRRVKAPFRAICTILVLCYTGITSACLKILQFAVIGDKTVLYFSGNTEFFSGKHAAYGSIALLFMVFFVVLFPLVLMFRPFFQRCLQPVFNLNRLKPIFDVLQSCYKDQHRSFAAFYFVCRLVLLVIATYVLEGPVKRLLIEVACVMILFIFTYLKPYKRAKHVKEGESSYDWVNKSDAILLLNLLVMAVFSSATENDDTRPNNKNVLKVLVNILAYVPLLVLAWHVYRKTKARCWSEWCDYENEEQPAPPITPTVTYAAVAEYETVRISRSSLESLEGRGTNTLE